jgi:hypothetical protein
MLVTRKFPASAAQRSLHLLGSKYTASFFDTFDVHKHRKALWAPITI